MTEIELRDIVHKLPKAQKVLNSWPENLVWQYTESDTAGNSRDYVKSRGAELGTFVGPGWGSGIWLHKTPLEEL